MERQMATTSATPERLAKVKDAVDFLRAAGHEEEAVAVESLLPPPKPRRLPPVPPRSEHDLVPIAEAAARLGLSRNAVQRRIEIGVLEGVRDERNGYRFVTNTSLDRLLDLARAQEAIASFPYYLDAGPVDPDSLLGQMLRAAEELDLEGDAAELDKPERKRA
jgi:hypothetical protein